VLSAKAKYGTLNSINFSQRTPSSPHTPHPRPPNGFQAGAGKKHLSLRFHVATRTGHHPVKADVQDLPADDRHISSCCQKCLVSVPPRPAHRIGGPDGGRRHFSGASDISSAVSSIITPCAALGNDRHRHEGIQEIPARVRQKLCLDGPENMGQAGDNHKLLQAGKHRITENAGILGHPHQRIGDPGHSYGPIMRKGYLERTSLPEKLVVRFGEDDQLRRCHEKMSEADRLTGNRDLIMNSILYEYLFLLASKFPGKKTVITGKKSDHVENALKYIEDHYCDSITIQNVADHLGLNRSYLHRIFKAFTCVSIQNYLLDYRIRQACILLKNTDLSVRMVAHSVSYIDPLYFSRLFHQKMGMSPSEYRESPLFCHRQ
jgi:AraC-like DNA-binding protein